MAAADENHSADRTRLHKHNSLLSGPNHPLACYFRPMVRRWIIVMAFESLRESFGLSHFTTTTLPKEGNCTDAASSDSSAD